MLPVESVVRNAFDEARARGHTYVGSDHLLAALTKEPPGSPAREALEACGVDEALVANYLAEESVIASEPASISPNPRFYGIVGRAEGFAMASGSAQPRPEHFLLALIREPTGLHIEPLRAAGTTPSALQAALRTCRVAVPELEPPPFDDTRWGDRVLIQRREYDEGLPSRLSQLLPSGIRFGCNCNDEEAWVIAEEGFDLLPYLEQARADSDLS